MVVALHNAKDGARKRSSKTIPLLAFESGIAHLLRLPRYKLMEQHDKVAEAFGKRRIKIAKKAVFQNWPQALAPAPRTTVKDVEAWVRYEMRGTKDDYTDASLRCSHVMLSKGSREARSIGCVQQMMHWADLWKSEDVTVEHSQFGLGLFAMADIAAGKVVARGVTDPALWWPELETLIEDIDGKTSAMFGPTSLINSACAKHANAEFDHVRNGAVRAVTTRTIKRGAQIFVQYPSAGIEPCKCWCGAKVFQRKIKPGE